MRTSGQRTCPTDSLSACQPRDAKNTRLSAMGSVGIVWGVRSAEIAEMI